MAIRSFPTFSELDRGQTFYKSRKSCARKCLGLSLEIRRDL